MCKDDSSEREGRKVDARTIESRPALSGNDKQETRGVVVPLRTKQRRRAEYPHDDPNGDDPGPAAA
ncbi:MAG: hypothetical protein LOD94_12265 [Gammaproteobacteria bacterium]|nr:hypothetical protein [Gammaproteobacteria bacterium]